MTNIPRYPIYYAYSIYKVATLPKGVLEGKPARDQGKEEFKELISLVKNGLELPIPISTRPLEEAATALAELQSGKIVGRMILKP